MAPQQINFKIAFAVILWCLRCLVELEMTKGELEMTEHW